MSGVRSVLLRGFQFIEPCQPVTGIDFDIFSWIFLDQLYVLYMNTMYISVYNICNIYIYIYVPHIGHMRLEHQLWCGPGPCHGYCQHYTPNHGNY